MIDRHRLHLYVLVKSLYIVNYSRPAIRISIRALISVACRLSALLKLAAIIWKRTVTKHAVPLSCSKSRNVPDENITGNFSPLQHFNNFLIRIKLHLNFSNNIRACIPNFIHLYHPHARTYPRTGPWGCSHICQAYPRYKLLLYFLFQYSTLNIYTLSA